MTVQVEANRKGFLKSVLTLLTGTTIAQAIPIAISPILTRIYTPEDFGLLALYLSITSIFAVIITARYELAIMLPKEEADAKNLVVLSIVITSIISIVLLLIVMIWGKPLSKLLGNELIYPWLFMVPLSLLLTGVYQAFNYWSNRKQQYKRLAMNRVAQSLTTATVNLSLGPVKTGAMGLIAGNIVAQAISTIRLSYKTIKQDGFSISDISINRMKALSKRYDQFPKVSIWSGLLNTASVQLPIFALTAFFSGLIVGWYSLAHRVLSMPMSVLGSAVGQVFFQSSSNLKHQPPEKLKSMTFRAYKSMLLIGSIPMAIIFGFGDFLFSFVFGENWSIAGGYARLLSVWLLLVFVSSPLSLLFTVMEKEGVALLFNIAIFLTRILSILTGAFVFKDAFITILLYSGSGVLFWLWHCLYILKMVCIPYKKSFLFTITVICIIFGLSLLVRFMLLNSF